MAKRLTYTRVTTGHRDQLLCITWDPDLPTKREISLRCDVARGIFSAVLSPLLIYSFRVIPLCFYVRSSIAATAELFVITTLYHYLPILLSCRILLQSYIKIDHVLNELQWVFLHEPDVISVVHPTAK